MESVLLDESMLDNLKIGDKFILLEDVEYSDLYNVDYLVKDKENPTIDDVRDTIIHKQHTFGMMENDYVCILKGTRLEFKGFFNTCGGEYVFENIDFPNEGVGLMSINYPIKIKFIK